MSIFFSFISGALIVILSNVCSSYFELKRKLKEQHIEIKKAIYVDFREMYYCTRDKIIDGKYEELQDLPDETIKLNANLMARAEIYLPESIVNKMREFVQLLISLYPLNDDLNELKEEGNKIDSIADELKEKCKIIDSMADELLLIIKNDLNIE